MDDSILETPSLSLPCLLSVLLLPLTLSSLHY